MGCYPKWTKSWNDKKSKAILLLKKRIVITVFMIMKKLSIWWKIEQMKDALNSKLKFYFDEKNGLKLMKSIRKDCHVSVLIKWDSSSRWLSLYTASCGILTKWASESRTALYWARTYLWKGLLRNCIDSFEQERVTNLIACAAMITQVSFISIPIPVPHVGHVITIF